MSGVEVLGFDLGAYQEDPLDQAAEANRQNRAAAAVDYPANPRCLAYSSIYRDCIECKSQPVYGRHGNAWDKANRYVDITQLLGNAGKDQRVNLSLDIGLVHRVVDDHAVLLGGDSLE